MFGILVVMQKSTIALAKFARRRHKVLYMVHEKRFRAQLGRKLLLAVIFPPRNHSADVFSIGRGSGREYARRSRAAVDSCEAVGPTCEVGCVAIGLAGSLLFMISACSLIQHRDHFPSQNLCFRRRSRRSSSCHAIPSGRGSRGRSWARCCHKCRLVTLVQGRP